MTALTITRGYSGSGKTTLAKAWVAEAPPRRRRVNRDDLRAMLILPPRGDYQQEQQVTEVEKNIVRSLLKGGVSVIVDDTNLALRFARDWADLAAELGVDFEVIDVKTPRDICVVRDHARFNLGERHVGVDVINSQASRFPISQWKPIVAREAKPDHVWTPYVEPTRSVPEIYLVDIDGTIAKKRQGPGERDWHDYKRVGEDLPNPRVIELVQTLHYFGRARIVFMSGRKEHCREQTLPWLGEYLGEWTEASPLFMREDDDNRSDDVVKHELFHRHINGEYSVRAVFDDRDRVVAMWRAIGLTVAQVDYGNF